MLSFRLLENFQNVVVLRLYLLPRNEASNFATRGGLMLRYFEEVSEKVIVGLWVVLSGDGPNALVKGSLAAVFRTLVGDLVEEFFDVGNLFGVIELA